ncbi:MAG TPA: prepilin-type N-terminal cleavage/methylation domain-containing protein [Hyphomicrobiaceae bacterium]|nr:prepilin-type N-terminal cleavage/methylation domain-containing protein [Hyphomicrobiaceae bacterium]
MKGAGQRCASSLRQRGFTLLELLVVLGLLALALAVVAPSLGRARLSVMVRSTAYELAANLRASRAAARSTSIEHVLTIDLARRLYWAEGVVGQRRLPPGVAVEVTVPQSERITGAVGRIRFFPDGSASGARLVLHDRRSTSSIVVDWLTGDVRIQGNRP